MHRIAFASLAAAVIASGSAVAAPSGSGGGAGFSRGGGSASGQWQGGGARPSWNQGGGRPAWGHPGPGYWGPARGWGWRAGWGWGWGSPWGWGWGSAWGWGWGSGWGWGVSPSFTVVLPVAASGGWSSSGFPLDDGLPYTAMPQSEFAAPVVAPNPPSYWFYCAEPAGYYPYVQTCSKPWIPVQPQGAPPAQSAPPASPQ